MRYELITREGTNRVIVRDKVTGANYYGKVVNGAAVANTALEMRMIAKMLREQGETAQ